MYPKIVSSAEYDRILERYRTPLETRYMMNGQSFKRAPLGAISHRSADPFVQVHSEGMNGTCFYQPPPMANSNTLTNDTMTMRSGLAPARKPPRHMANTSNPYFGPISREDVTNGRCFYQPPPRREANASPMAIMKGLSPDRVPLGPIEGSLAAPSKKVKKQGKRSKRSKKAECVSKVDQNSMNIDALEQSVYMREANASSTAIMKGLPPDRAPLGPIKVNDAMVMGRDLASERTPLGPIEDRSTHNFPQSNRKGVQDYGFYEKSVQMREANTPSTAVMKGLPFDRAPLGPIQTNDTVAMERDLAAQFEIDLDTLSSEASNAPLGSGECTEKLFHMTPNIHSPANDSSNIQPTWKEVEQEETADVVVEVLPRYLHTPSKPAHGPTDHGATGDASLQPKVDICEDSMHIRELPHIKEETYEPSIEQNIHKTNSDHGQKAITSVLPDMQNTVRPYKVEVERSNMIGQFEFENKRKVLMSTIETQTDILEEDLNAQTDVDDTHMQRSENTSQRDVETESVNSSFVDIMGTYTYDRRIVKTGKSGVETIRAVASLVDSFSILMDNKHPCTSTPTTIANGTRDDTNADRHQTVDDKSNDIINKMGNKETRCRSTFKDAGISNGTQTVTAEDASQRRSRPSNWYISIDKYQNGMDNKYTEPVKIYHHTLRQRQRLLNNGNKSKYISIPTTIDNGISFTRDYTNEDRYQIVDDRSSDFINKLGSTETPYRQTIKRAGISSGAQTVDSAAKDVSQRNYRPAKSDVYNYQNDIDNPKYTESANIPHHTLNERQRILDNGNKNAYTSTPTTIANNTSLTRDATNADRYQIVDDTSSDLKNKLKSTERQSRKIIKDAGIFSCTQTVYSAAKDVSQRNYCPLNSYGYTEKYQIGMDNPKYTESAKPPDDSLSKRQRAYEKCTKYLERIDGCDDRWNKYTEQPWHGKQQGDWDLKEYRSMDEEHPGQNIFKNLKLDLPVVAERPNRLFETTSQMMPHGYQELDEDLKSDTGQLDRSDKYRIGTPPGDDDAEETGCCGCFPRKNKRPSNKNNSNKGSRGSRVMRFFRRVKSCFT